MNLGIFYNVMRLHFFALFRFATFGILSIRVSIVTDQLIIIRIEIVTTTKKLSPNTQNKMNEKRVSFAISFWLHLMKV